MDDLTWIVRHETGERSRRWNFKLLPQPFQRRRRSHVLDAGPPEQNVFFSELLGLIQSPQNCCFGAKRTETRACQGFFSRFGTGSR
jgi:hypothetical protein